MVRILLTKPTHDCHDRGVRYLAKRFRDESFEVVFTNFLLPSEIVATAVQEDVDVIGISSSSGAHLAVFEEVMRELPRHELDDVVVIAGGNIPPADADQLRAWGVREVFGPGSQPDDAVELIKGLTAAAGRLAGGA
ncbi:MAG TPA: cobalamin-dependent protein [Solirubrobacteraceae bacterium]|nr:cobalamin-dependent protein [Solirubrobacteraceae bacterium]